MGLSSRLQYLEQTLDTLQYEDSLRAMDLVMKEMCIEKGFKRHNGIHYYYHLTDVTLFILNSGIRDQDIITAALLHDLVEDVLDEHGAPVYSLKTIEEIFNKRVAKIVKLVTKNPNIDYKKDKAALEEYLLQILEDIGAIFIKVSDRLNNLTTLRDATPEKKLRQAIETRDYYIPFLKEARLRYPRHAKIFLQVKTTFETITEGIIDNHHEVMELRKQLEDKDNKLQEQENEISELKQQLAKYINS